MINLAGDLCAAKIFGIGFEGPDSGIFCQSCGEARQEITEEGPRMNDISAAAVVTHKADGIGFIYLAIENFLYSRTIAGRKWCKIATVGVIGDLALEDVRIADLKFRP